jgi:hypothetical protein
MVSIRRSQLALSPDYFDYREPMEVAKVRVGSHIGPVPGFDPEWDVLTRLTWEAGILKYDTGVTVRVARAQFYSAGKLIHDRYSLSHAGGIMGPLTESQAHDRLIGIGTGIEIARRGRDAGAGQ